MARDTVINDTGMIEHRYSKSAGYVTGTTILVGHNVAGFLANCTTRTTIMTGVTAFTHNFGVAMIHKSVSEINGVMAYPAIFVCALMNCRSRRRSGSNQHIIGIAIMAGFTIFSSPRVYEALCWFERSSGNVAHITILVCR